MQCETEKITQTVGIGVIKLYECSVQSRPEIVKSIQIKNSSALKSTKLVLITVCIQIWNNHFTERGLRRLRKQINCFANAILCVPIYESISRCVVYIAFRCVSQSMPDPILGNSSNRSLDSDAAISNSCQDSVANSAGVFRMLPCTTVGVSYLRFKSIQFKSTFCCHHYLFQRCIFNHYGFISSCSFHFYFMIWNTTRKIEVQQNKYYTLLDKYVKFKSQSTSWRVDEEIN